MKDVYKFKDYFYEGASAPFYEKYKGHKFVIDHASPEDPSGKHVWLVCLTDIDLEVGGYVHLDDLEIVDTDLEQILADYENKIIEAVKSS